MLEVSSPQLIAEKFNTVFFSSNLSVRACVRACVRLSLKLKKNIFKIYCDIIYLWSIVRVANFHDNIKSTEISTNTQDRETINRPAWRAMLHDIPRLVDAQWEIPYQQ